MAPTYTHKTHLTPCSSNLKKILYSIYGEVTFWLWPVIWDQVRIFSLVVCWCPKISDFVAFGFFRVGSFYLYRKPRHIHFTICLISFTINCRTIKWWQKSSADLYLSGLLQHHGLVKWVLLYLFSQHLLSSCYWPTMLLGARVDQKPEKDMMWFSRAHGQGQTLQTNYCNAFWENL